MAVRFTRTLFLTLCAAFIFAACDSEPAIDEAQATAFVDVWSATVGDTLLEQVEGSSMQRELSELVKAMAAKERSQTTRDEPPYSQFVDEVYQSREYRPALVSYGTLTDRGQVVHDALQKVRDHHLQPEGFQLDRIQESTGALLARVEAPMDTNSLAPTGEEKQALISWISSHKVSELSLDEDLAQTLTERLQAMDNEARAQVLRDRHQAAEKVAAESAQLEFLLARGLAKYARELRYHRLKEIFIHPRQDDFYNDPEIRQRRPDEARGPYEAGALWRRAAAIAESMADPVAINHENIRRTLRETLEGENFATVVADIPPLHPQYRRLVDVHVRYRDIVDAGGWPEVPVDRSLRPGQRKPVVTTLKERLKIEGYLPADAAVDDHYDDALTNAVREYQETHQMEVTGSPHNIFWRSLNVPAERRLRQIRLNLERWHRTNVMHELDRYVFINIPDFHAEVYENQKKTMRFRMIAGNNERQRDEDSGELINPNRTPVPLAAYIDRIIYNPYWNVTPRIRQEEILPEVKKYVAAQYERKLEKHRLQARAERAQRLLTGQPPTTTVLASTTEGGEPAENPPPAPRPAPDEIRSLADLPPEVLERDFPYYDRETGQIDVATTHPEHIPGWYAANNYEVMHPGRNWEYVRMTPGEHNSLGLVKIIFPNYHDVYLHDTPAKALFTRDVRAFSFGCIRIQNPLEFSEHMLRADGIWDEFNVPEALRTGEYLPIFFRRKIPVYLEYYTIRVDEQNRPHFLADAYGYDEDPSSMPTVMKRTLSR